MLVQFGNNWIQKIPLTAKLDLAYGVIQFWLSSQFFSPNYFQIGQECSPITYTNRCNGAFRVSDSLPLVQLKYSLNTLCSQPETNHVLNRLATSISQHKM